MINIWQKMTTGNPFSKFPSPLTQTQTKKETLPSNLYNRITADGDNRITADEDNRVVEK